MIKKISNILFDLDGTIIEPQEGIINSILYSLNKLSIPESNYDKLKHFIGPPLIDYFAECYNLDTEKANKAVKFYREYFSTKGIYQNTLYDGVLELLQYLKKQVLDYL